MSLHIQSVHVQQLRNLHDLHLNHLQTINIITGLNGSGKSSILEALHVLATGRSFRRGLVRQMIEHGQSESIVFAKVGQHRIGVSNTAQGEQTLRLDGGTLKRQSDIARLLPLQFIDPEGLNMLDSGSKPRRQLLDWLAFHVEPHFYELWLRYQRAVNQRNQLLKNTYGHEAELNAWEHELEESGQLVHALRLTALERWQLAFKEVLATLLPDQVVELTYIPGFSLDQPLSNSLYEQREREQQRGHTLIGPHRASLSFKAALGPAEHVLSRGQKKLLVLSLRLSQLRVLQQIGRPSVVLLDDMGAELDALAQARLLQSLQGLESQLFITTLALKPLQDQLKTLGLTARIFKLQNGQLVDESLNSEILIDASQISTPI